MHIEVQGSDDDRLKRGPVHVGFPRSVYGDFVVSRDISPSAPKQTRQYLWLRRYAAPVRMSLVSAAVFALAIVLASIAIAAVCGLL